MIKLAVMQGRLSPPEDGRFQSFPRLSWRDEFSRAVEAGIPAIEWIDDTYGRDDNPLRSPEGLHEMRELMDQHGVAIPSICADSFMEEPFIRCTESERSARLELLKFLCKQAREIGAKHIGIPLLDNSAMNTEEEIDDAVAAVQTVIPTLEKFTMELHFETSLDPASFQKFLSMLDHPLIKVTYDTGNSASLGFNPYEEFKAYGERVGSVHIKDRIRGGGTVTPGTGDTDFEAVNEELRRIDFAGLFTLQVARGEDGDEVNLIKESREFAERTFS